MHPESKLKLFITDLTISVDNLELQNFADYSDMTNDDWMKLISLCLSKNRKYILDKIPHKSLPSIETIQKILSVFSYEECGLEFAEAYDQLYQIVKARITEACIDPKKIRGMTIEQPNNLYVYHV